MASARKAAANTHTTCRSLLQKAVRRGNLELGVAIAEHLVDKNVDDGAWFNQRAAIMAFEECPQVWGQMSLQQYGSKGSIKWSRQQALELIQKVAMAVKCKQATGLGTLAYFAQRDPRTLEPHHKTLKPHVAEVARRIGAMEKGAPIFTGSTPEVVDPIRLAASTFATRQSWPWDKAFMVAAAYLAEQGWTAEYSVAGVELECPVWVGLDRHTEQGKLAIAAVAEATGIHRKIVEWTGFYFESAILNAEAQATYDGIDWWQEELRWRLGLLGVSPKEGAEIWGSLRDQVKAKLESTAGTDLDHLSRVKETRPTILRSPAKADQGSLWSD